MNSFGRRLEILRYLKDSAMSKSTEEIINHLMNREMLCHPTDARRDSANRRTVQRDLRELSDNRNSDNPYALRWSCGQQVDVSGSTIRWNIDNEHSGDFSFAKTTQETALAFVLAKKHLPYVIPLSSYNLLKGHFDRALDKIDRQSNSVQRRDLRRLVKRVEFDQRGQRLQTAASLNLETLDIIYAALADNKQLKFTYYDRSRVLHPAGVVIKSPKLYLVGKLGDKQGYTVFLIQRISDIAISVLDSKIPSGFDLKRFIERGFLQIKLDNSTQSIVLRVEHSQESNHLINDLSENQIHPQQTLVKKNGDDPHYVLTLPGPLTADLQSWILGRGRFITVLEPASARAIMIEEIRRMGSNHALL